MARESEQELRGYADALAGVLRDLERQVRIRETVQKELARRMRDCELTKEQHQEMLWELDEARELAERTEREAFDMLGDVMDKLCALKAWD